ncbi:hypothetical protein [Lactococcus lactis]|uniref:hypothetical protein n=1 Tax=Lactococcus lactis TaxID=1358 RepID=UPI0018AB7256|nr:hypothetical protein [Lactococcus lactis]
MTLYRPFYDFVSKKLTDRIILPTILLFYIIANYQIFGKFSILLKEKTAETVFLLTELSAFIL